MKKICFFSGDITRSGGTERVATMIANELAKQEKYEICFLSLCEQAETVFFSLESKIVRYKLGQKWIQPGPGYLPLIPKIHRFFKEQKIDIIVDIDIVLDCLTIPATYGLSTKVVSWEHFNCLFEMSVLYRRLILKYSVRHSDYVITLTERDKEDYAKLTKRVHNIEAIYNPMELNCDVTNRKQQNHIITVGRLVPEKGIEYLLEVAQKVLSKHTEWKWYVVGEGSERETLERYIVENNLEKQLILTGLVSNVNEYLAQAKIFVLTSKSEGLGMCLLEAKAQDLPCVSFDVPTGPNEIIEDGINGYLITPFDCDTMADRINDLIINEKLRKQFGDLAKNNIQKFEMVSIINKWNRVFDKLCE